MKRVWYYLRDLVWPSVLAVALAVVALVVALLGGVTVAGVLATLAVVFAILSVRS
jgi:hypothetical protein